MLNIPHDNVFPSRQGLIIQIPSHFTIMQREVGCVDHCPSFLRDDSTSLEDIEKFEKRVIGEFDAHKRPGPESFEL